MNATRLLVNFVDIRAGEFRRTGLMFLYFYLLIASFIIIKAVRDSLFLNRLGADQLPYVYILIAVLVGVVAWIYAELSRDVRLSTLIHVTLWGAIVCLLGFWWLLQFNRPELYYALYLWSSIVGIFTTAQSWLLANLIFDTRQAKRLFGVIGAGAILGGTTGGILTAGLASLLGTETLLLISALGYFLCSGVVFLIWSYTGGRVEQGQVPSSRPVENSKPQASKESIQHILRSSPHLRALVAIIGLTMLVSTLVDYQFKAIASETFTSKDALTAFMGIFMSLLGAMSFIIQLFLTGAILKSLGLGVALLFLPVGLALGSLAIAIVPGLISGAFAKLIDGGFRYSINKASVELLYLPVPGEIKNKIKAFIDTVVDRFAKGIGGVILLVSSGFLSLSISQISLISMGLLSVLIFSAIVAAKEYLHSLRLALQGHRVNLSTPHLNLSDPKTVGLVTQNLLESSDGETLYSLKLLEQADLGPYMPTLKVLQQRANPDVRAAALNLLTETNDPSLLPEITKMIKDQEITIQVEAMHFVCAHSQDPKIRMEELLSDHDPRIVSAAIVCGINHSGSVLRPVIEPLFNDMIQDRGPQGVERRREAAKALGWIRSHSGMHRALEQLLCDDANEVVKEALKSARAVKRKELVPLIIRALQSKAMRSEAKTTLVSYGPSVLSTVASFLENSQEPLLLREALPEIIAQIGGVDASTILVRNLDQSVPRLRYQVLKALNKICSNNSEALLDADLIEAKLIDEFHYYYELLLLRHHPSIADNSQGKQLLAKAIEEQMTHRFEIIFRLFGLRFPNKDIINAYYALLSNEVQVRANATEFLDNLLSSRLKRILIPIIDRRSLSAVLEAGRRLFSINWTSQEQILKYLIDGRDPWLKTCALYVVGEQKLTTLTKHLLAAVKDPDAIVKETAQVALERMEQFADN